MLNDIFQDLIDAIRSFFNACKMIFERILAAVPFPMANTRYYQTEEENPQPRATSLACERRRKIANTQYQFYNSKKKRRPYQRRNY